MTPTKRAIRDAYLAGARLGMLIGFFTCWLVVLLILLIHPA